MTFRFLRIVLAHVYVIVSATCYDIILPSGICIDPCTISSQLVLVIYGIIITCGHIYMYVCWRNH